MRAMRLSTASIVDDQEPQPLLLSPQGRLLDIKAAGEGGHKPKVAALVRRSSADGESMPSMYEREKTACTFGGCTTVSYHDRVVPQERQTGREKPPPLGSAFVFGETEEAAALRERTGGTSPTSPKERLGVASCAPMADFSPMQHSRSTPPARSPNFMAFERPSKLDLGGLPSSVGRTSPTHTINVPSQGRSSLGLGLRRTASEDFLSDRSENALPWHAQASITLAGSVAGSKERDLNHMGDTSSEAGRLGGVYKTADFSSRASSALGRIQGIRSDQMPSCEADRQLGRDDQELGTAERVAVARQLGGREWTTGYHKIMETLQQQAQQAENTTGGLIVDRKQQRLVDDRQLTAWQSMQPNPHQSVHLHGSSVHGSPPLLSTPARVNFRQQRMLVSDQPRMHASRLNGDLSSFRLPSGDRRLRSRSTQPPEARTSSNLNELSSRAQ